MSDYRRLCWCCWGAQQKAQTCTIQSNDRLQWGWCVLILSGVVLTDTRNDGHINVFYFLRHIQWQVFFIFTFYLKRFRKRWKIQFSSEILKTSSNIAKRFYKIMYKNTTHALQGVNNRPKVQLLICEKYWRPVYAVHQWKYILMVWPYR